MKFLVILPVFIAFAGAVNAQTSTGTQTTPKATQQQGALSHGSRDTTPGSPMGTGGAGGDMSGSPAASAIETDDQTSKAEAQKDTTASSESQAVKKGTNKKKTTMQRKTKSNM